MYYSVKFFLHQSMFSLCFQFFGFFEVLYRAKTVRLWWSNTVTMVIFLESFLSHDPMSDPARVQHWRILCRQIDPVKIISSDPLEPVWALDISNGAEAHDMVCKSYSGQLVSCQIILLDEDETWSWTIIKGFYDYRNSIFSFILPRGDQPPYNFTKPQSPPKLTQMY